MKLALLKYPINILAAAAGLASILGCFGNLNWVLELCQHPRLQYCWILLLAVAINAIDHNKYVWLYALPLGLNLALILPLFWGNIQPRNTRSNADSLKVLHVNLDRNNTQYDAAVQYIQQQSADIIFLQEVTPQWFDRIRTQLPNYRVILSQPQKDSQGVAMMLPPTPNPEIEIIQTQIVHLPEKSTRPIIETLIRWQNREVALLSLHTTRPRNHSTSAFQQQEFAAAAHWSQVQQTQFQRPVLIIGDFNTTPWSSRARQLQKQGNLVDSQRGFGWQTTWPAPFPPPLRIAIDHCLHSSAIATLHRRSGVNIGSDHLPLWVEVLMRF
jgi:endonuclease/exonuclease/phosphatase (EEP) superfamily protein YafD